MPSRLYVKEFNILAEFTSYVVRPIKHIENRSNEDDLNKIISNFIMPNGEAEKRLWNRIGLTLLGSSL